MKNVLWISRHEMEEKQKEELKEITGGDIRIIQWKETLRSIQEIKPQIEESDIVAAVLPMDLLLGLLKETKEKPLIQSVTERVSTGTTRTFQDGRTEPEFEYRHKYWQQILNINIETRKCERGNLKVECIRN